MPHRLHLNATWVQQSARREDGVLLQQHSIGVMDNYNKDLTPDQASAFLEVVDASLRIKKKAQFFSWLQGHFQFLLPHEVLLCGLSIGVGRKFTLEMLSSTRYVTDAHVTIAMQDEAGVVMQAIQAWQESSQPVLVDPYLKPGNFGSFTVPKIDNGNLHESELRNIAAYGLSSADGSISSFFCFSRVSGELNANHAYMLELLVPYLNSVLMRVSDGVANIGEVLGDTATAGMITAREKEILQWVHTGKSNWEIATILEISPLTVKNHMQNILRKLDVQNRSHAAAKATRLGLIRHQS
ncbi:transcriptional regulator EpsA [Methylobacillus arboreus]|uniref:XrtB/PEP-CTERM-associated transcriptional regulator EpsA n=1 Tax=Methylobacillus arboreus TaxID=755170 RepID=UPI001E6106C9|nr:XrtB/PEP-CTERM-associated transcriptional regulator EpsA [Methylobacillus arboreus]MCB5190620.1 transcriptional regulator EpsA [Methylobacillus arboreus]